MKMYDVIVQRHNDGYKVTIPALPGINTEGRTRDEAIYRAQEAIEEFFKRAEVITVAVDVPALEFRPYATANDQLRDAFLNPFPEDPDAQQNVEIYAERRRQREEQERQLDMEEMRKRQHERRLEDMKRRQLDEGGFKEKKR